MPASTGDKVRVHYTGRLQDDTVFDTSEERGPLEFTVGSGNVIPGFEQAVVGMEPGEQQSVTIPATDAYGERREDLVVTLDRERLSGDVEPEPGQQLSLRQQNGDTFTATVEEVTDETVRLDTNHPLAGQELHFDIRLVEIG